MPHATINILGASCKFLNVLFCRDERLCQRRDIPRMARLVVVTLGKGHLMQTASDVALGLDSYRVQ